MMLVTAVPSVSRNSVTGTITGRPDRAIFRLVSVVSNHSCGNSLLLTISVCA